MPCPAAGSRRRQCLFLLLLLLCYLAGAAVAVTGPTAFSTITARTMTTPRDDPPTTATVPRGAALIRAGPRGFATVSSKGAGGAAENPFTVKAALVRYWSRKVPNGRSKPAFLLAKASPLSAQEAALYERLAEEPSALAARLPSFCSAAALFCFPELAAPVDQRGGAANFAQYSSKDFSNYGTGKAGGISSFKNYSSDENVPIDSFRRYSRDSAGHSDSFTNYAPNGNVVTANFTSYATGATGGAGTFTSYDRSSNVPDLKFTNYDSDADGRVQSFRSYSDDTNAGDQSFSGYGKRATGIPLSFTSYGNNSNVIGSTFRNYGEDGSSANDTFTSYGFNGNVPENRFSSYGGGGHGGSESFSSYRDQSNVGDDSFSSYAKGATGGAAASFSGYGQSFNPGSDTFSGYGEKAVGKTPVGFTTYGENTTFKDYADKKSVSFNNYNVSGAGGAAAPEKMRTSRWVEPGRFFRESMLKKGTVMPMPDFQERMPRRAFLPRSIARKLPFSSSRLAELYSAFNATADSALGEAMASTVAECERAPSRGETKLCATSAEDMIDFATSVLGSDVVVRSTASTGGSRRKVTVGEVSSVDGGRVTGAVSCHQSLFPYQVYYCHSVPKVRVYEADILAGEEEGGGAAKINHGVAICHLDTSDWSAGHGAFVALGDGPGQIEVCHWIFPGDMTWTVSD